MKVEPSSPQFTHTQQKCAFIENLGGCDTYYDAANNNIIIRWDGFPKSWERFSHSVDGDQLMCWPGVPANDSQRMGRILRIASLIAHDMGLDDAVTRRDICDGTYTETYEVTQ